MRAADRGAAPAAAPAVRFVDVVKVYAAATPVTALDGVSLEIPRGEIAAIVGPSGSGKSTLLHLAAGIDTPTSGEIEVGGRALSRLSDDDLTRHRRASVGMVYQFFHLLPTLSARENVALPALLAGGREYQVLARADELLAAVGLADRRHARPHTLSGGEMQRVSLARALLPGPAVLLADEPTGNLDSKSGAAVLELIRDLARRHGAAVLLVTHSAEAAAIAERVIELRDGRVVDDRRTPA